MGSVYRTEINGTPVWQASKSVMVTIAATGEKKRKRITGTGPTPAMAVARLEAKLSPETAALRPAASTPSAADMTYGEWFQTWVDELPAWKVSDIVRAKYRRMGEMYLLPRLGSRLMTDIDSELVQSVIWRDLMGSATLSEATVRNIYRVCQMSFAAAVETKRVSITVNPAAAVRTPRRSEQIASVAQETAVTMGLIKWMHETRHPNEAQVLLQWTGIRQSERLGLSWANIKHLDDDKRATMVVSQQLARHQDGGYYLKHPKTRAGVREIPLVEPFLSTMREWKTTQAAQREAVEAAGGVWGGPEGGWADLVFLTPQGGLIRHGADRALWYRVLADYTGGRYTWVQHKNRHIAATLMAEAGVSVAVLRVIFGWGSDAMAHYYSHLSNVGKRPAMEAFARELGKDRDPELDD